MEQRSTLSSIFRSFAIAVSKFIGYGIGIIFVMGMIEGFFSRSHQEPMPPAYQVQVLSNGNFERSAWKDGGDFILQLNIEGTIGSKELNKDGVQEQLLASREGRLKKSQLRGVFLSINSPGGGNNESLEIFNLIKFYKEKFHVPVYAHIDGICASGGYLIACSADKITSTEGSIIGSIGTRINCFNFYGLMEKLGVQQKIFYKGIEKDELDPFSKWSEEEGKSIMPLIDFAYEGFVRLVHESRPKISTDALVNEYGAQVFTPKFALEHHFIDEYGLSRTEALQKFSEALGMNSSYKVIRLRKPAGLEELLNSKIPVELQLSAESLLKGIDPR